MKKSLLLLLLFTVINCAYISIIKTGTLHSYCGDGMDLTTANFPVGQDAAIAYSNIKCGPEHNGLSRAEVR